jgi:organic radical activating enzyme
VTAEIEKPEIEKPPELKVINKQPKEGLFRHPRGYVELVSVYLTIQGEGPLTGHPSVFIRTAGCDLQCPFCDTLYTTGRKFLSPPDIVTKVQELRPSGLVVITGGEPFRQNITPLVRLLLNTGYRVQIETNGTFHWQDFPYRAVTIVCSPKTPKIHPQIPVDYYKYVLNHNFVDEEDGLPTSVLGSGVRPARPRGIANVPVYVSPEDSFNEEENEKNLRAAIRSVLKFDYILSCQWHKDWGLE